MEHFDILDESGKPVGHASRHDCHNGTFHLHGVVHVLVFTGDGRLILQKRSPDKEIQPGKWDTSVGGHISCSETLDDALCRETEEELGIRGADFEKLYRYIMNSDVERELVTTYLCIWDGAIEFDKHEIEAVGSFTEDEIHAHIGTDYFTPNFEEEWEYFLSWRRNGHI